MRRALIALAFSCLCHTAMQGVITAELVHVLRAQGVTVAQASPLHQHHGIQKRLHTILSNLAGYNPFITKRFLLAHAPLLYGVKSGTYRRAVRKNSAWIMKSELPDVLKAQIASFNHDVESLAYKNVFAQRMLLGSGAAATVLGAIFLGWYFWPGNKDKSAQQSVAHSAESSGEPVGGLTAAGQSSASSSGSAASSTTSSSTAPSSASRQSGQQRRGGRLPSTSAVPATPPRPDADAKNASAAPAAGAPAGSGKRVTFSPVADVRMMSHYGHRKDRESYRPTGEERKTRHVPVSNKQKRRSKASVPLTPGHLFVRISSHEVNSQGGGTLFVHPDGSPVKDADKGLVVKLRDAELNGVFGIDGMQQASVYQKFIAAWILYRSGNMSLQEFVKRGQIQAGNYILVIEPRIREGDVVYDISYPDPWERGKKTLKGVSVLSKDDFKDVKSGTVSAEADAKKEALLALQLLAWPRQQEDLVTTVKDVITGSFGQTYSLTKDEKYLMIGFLERVFTLGSRAIPKESKMGAG